MSFKYHIDGLQEFGYNPINRFEYSLHMYMNTVKRVCELYKCASVLDIKGYVAHFCYLRLHAFDTFSKVLIEHRDYLSANCLLRMLGDSVSVFKLIYGEKDKDLLLLRHALYVIDGCENNLNVLPLRDENDGSLPDDEFEDSQNVVRHNREHRERLIREAKEILDSSPLKEKKSDAFERIVEDRNWKFKEFKDIKKKNNQYEWRELYQLIDCCQEFDLLSYISQYVHGLSMSNLIINLNENVISGVLAEGFGLLERLHEYTLEFFSEEYRFILEGLFAPDTRDKIRSYFDEQHRPDDASWNQAILNKIREASLWTSTKYN